MCPLVSGALKASVMGRVPWFRSQFPREPNIKFNM
jgi:hypothetical protein